MSLVPMHSWHPMVIHFPVVALLLEVLSTPCRPPGLRGLALAPALFPRGRRLGVVGALGLGGVGSLGGELVFRHALGIPSEMLRQVRGERVGYDEEQMKPAATTSRDTAAAGAARDTTKPKAKPRTQPRTGQRT